MTNTKNLIGIGLAIVACLLMFLSVFSTHYKDKAEVLQNTIDVLNDSVQQLKLDDGRNLSAIAAFSATNTQLLKELDSKDSSINALKDEVKRYEKKLRHGGSVVVVSSSTNISGTVPSTPSNHKPSIDISAPQNFAYDFYFTDKWINLSGTAKSDSTSFDLTVVNKYTVAVGTEKGKPFAEVTNSNPYTTVKTMRAFLTDFPKPKRFGMGLQAGYGVSKDGLSPYIGAGISYNFIRF